MEWGRDEHNFEYVITVVDIAKQSDVPGFHGTNQQRRPIPPQQRADRYRSIAELGFQQFHQPAIVATGSEKQNWVTDRPAGCRWNADQRSSRRVEECLFERRRLIG